jgi:hypothetical protein
MMEGVAISASQESGSRASRGLMEANAVVAVVSLFSKAKMSILQ